MSTYKAKRSVDPSRIILPKGGSAVASPAERKLVEDVRKSLAPNPGDFELFFGDLLKRVMRDALKVSE